MNIQKLQHYKSFDFIEGCKQMSAESAYALRRLLKEKLHFNDAFINECTKDFVKILLE